MDAHNVEEFEERAASARRMKREATQARREVEAALWALGEVAPAPYPWRWPMGKLAE